MTPPEDIRRSSRARPGDDPAPSDPPDPGPAPATPAILVFGGSFDPPHRAHVELPRLVARALGCARILYVPTSANPLKDAPIAAAAHRLAMLRLALRAAPGTEICTIELDAAGPSYTVDTLAALAASGGPAVRYRLLIGADAAASFHRWRQPRRILELATPAVMLRPAWGRDELARRLAPHWTPEEVARWMAWTVEVPQAPASSRELRRRLASGEDGAQWLDPAVLAYIHEHGLYGCAALGRRSAEAP